MPDWNGPAEIARDELYLTTVLHVCFGCAIWEYLTELHYEWGVFTRARRYRWTIWVYTSCRLFMVIGFVLLVAAASGWSSHHCTAQYAAAQATSYASIGLASLLIVFRIIAVWEKHIAIAVISYAVWFTGVVLNIRDLLLLTLMLVGILRKRGAPKFGVVRLLYRQGVVWLTVAVLVELPVLALCILNLNAPLTLLFQPVELVTLGICSGRMYRGLMNYAFDPSANSGIPLKDLTPVQHPTRPPYL